MLTTIQETIPANGQSRPKILAVEFEVRGHHADYIRNFAHVWIENGIEANIEFLVTQPFKTYHQNIVDHFDRLGSDRVSLRFITTEEQSELDRNPRMKYLRGWNLYCKYAKELSADYGLLMYSDYFQLPIWLGQRSPCPFSAIYFRPTFHYPTFQNYRPTIKNRFVAMRKRWLLQQVLKVKELRELYCLDPFVIPYIQKNFKTQAHVSHLADSFAMQRGSQERAVALRDELQIQPDRKIYCLLGVLDSRKGPRQLLESVSHIPPEVGKRVCILLLGYIPERESQEIEDLAAKMNGVNNVQVVLRNQYIESTEVQHYYAMSDVILSTYQNHMGSSSALIRAALEYKPVLSSDFGLMGEIVNQLKLGLMVDSTSPVAIANGIVRMADLDLNSIIDRGQADRLVAENSQSQLGKDLRRMLEHLPSRLPPSRSTAEQLHA